MLVLGPATEISLITTYKNPAWSIGTIGYYQSGVFGTPLGLLLSLTTTPKFTQMLMTSNGLQSIH